MSINWYPGHMVTAKKDVTVTMRKTDVVIEVLDARVPLSSLNPLVESLRNELGRPALKILNKIDIADPERTKEWLAYFNAQKDTHAIGISAKKAADVARIPKAAQALGKKPNLRLMILGIPNVGKSTLMNTLLKRPVAKVGDEPAITKQQSAHKLGKDMYIIDTPGMMWPGVPQDVAYRLAATHSIGRNAYHEDLVAQELGSYLLTHYRSLVEKRYGAITGDLLEHVAKKRSLVTKGGGLDLLKAGQAILNDYRSGILGRTTLETPPAEA